MLLARLNGRVEGLLAKPLVAWRYGSFRAEYEWPLSNDNANLGSEMVRRVVVSALVGFGASHPASPWFKVVYSCEEHRRTS